MTGEISVDKYSFDYIKNYNVEEIDNIRFTSIIILTFNQLEYTKLCIESIRKFTPKGSYEIIVIDNNSSDNTQDWLREQNDLNVIYNKYNAGFPKGCNQGIKIARGESVLLLNNDVIVTPNWLNNLDRALYSNDEIGAVGPISNSCTNGQSIPTLYKNIDEMIRFASTINNSDNIYELKHTLVGFCILIKKEVLYEVGLLDEIFGLGNFEDRDLSYRIIEKGYKLLLCKRNFIHHFGSISFRDNVSEYRKAFDNNLNTFNKKWGINQHYSIEPRNDVINLIECEKEKNIRVLEVGCGMGTTLLSIKNTYPNAHVYGIEINEGQAKVAKGIANTLVGDIEEIKLPYEESYFDYVIFADVLQNLKNPWKILTNISKYIKKGGYVLASIPNIMHITTVREILTGSFSYVEAGLLDKTHLRFFTSHEIQKLFNQSGYEVIIMPSNVISISDKDTKLIDEICSITDEGFRGQYQTYQYLIKAAKSN